MSGSPLASSEIINDTNASDFAVTGGTCTATASPD